MGVITGSITPSLAALVQPPPGGKRVKKIFVTDDGKLQVEYEGIPE